MYVVIFVSCTNGPNYAKHGVAPMVEKCVVRHRAPCCERASGPRARAAAAPRRRAAGGRPVKYSALSVLISFHAALWKA